MARRESARAGPWPSAVRWARHNGGMTDDEETPRERGTPGAEGEAAKDTPPPAPAKDDDSPLGDTDQHSSADA